MKSKDKNYFSLLSMTKTRILLLGGALLIAAGLLARNYFASQGTLSAQEHFLEGNARFAQGSYIQALEHYEMALPGNENNPNLQLNRGLTLEKLGREEEGLKAFHKALQLNPADPRSYERLARIYDQRMQVPRARLFETIGAIHAGRSRADFSQLFTLVARVPPENKLEGYSLMAFVFFKLKRIPEAQRAWQASLKLDANQPGLLMNLFLTTERGDPRQAVVYLRRYVALAESDPKERPKLAAARQRLKALEEKLNTTSNTNKQQ